MLKVEQVSSGYRAGDVIHEISFSLETGGRLYITGPNGCGKTTLLKCIAGLNPYTGRVTIDGTDARTIRRKELAKKIGILTQITSVYFPYTIFDTVALGRYAHMKGVFAGLSAEDRKYVEECIDMVGLYPLRDRKISELSGGQLQRVYLARLFAQNPDIILLDEPTNHLDLKYQIELLEYVTEWSRRSRKTVVGVLHDLNLVNHFAEEVLLLSDGRVYARGKPADALSADNLRYCYQLDIRGWMSRSLAEWQTGEPAEREKERV